MSLSRALAVLITAVALGTTAIATDAVAKPIGHKRKASVCQKPGERCVRSRRYAPESEGPQFERDEPLIVCMNAPCGTRSQRAVVRDFLRNRR